MVKHNCLIVEDSRMMREFLSIGLKRIRGLSITQADDGMEALRKLQQTKFDLIIVDINMPILDGLKLIKHIRSDAIHQDVPVIIVTTEGAEEDKQRAISLGVDLYITKPVQLESLIQQVKQILAL